MKRISFRRQLVFFFALDLLLVLVAVVLIITLTHLFAHSSPDTAKLSFVEGAGDVVLLEVSKQYSWVTLSKNGTLWLGEDNGTPKETLWPCEGDKVAALLSEVSKPFNAVKIADGVSSWRRLGVEEKDCFKLKVRQEGRQAVIWRFSSDTTEQTVVFRTSSGQTVWEAQSSIGRFLTHEANFWAESTALPSFSQADGGIKRGELFCLLPAPHLKPVLVQEASFDGGITAVFSVYKKDDAYVVRPSFSCPALPEMSLINYGYIMDGVGLEALLKEIAR